MLVMCFILSLGVIQGMKCFHPLVDSPAGLIRGLRVVNGSYTMFLGIPYAQVSDNPFGKSEPYPKFKSIYNAHEDPPSCPQMLGDTAIGSLDCLRINIFTPRSASTINKLPVLIWIYGGTFNTGFVKQKHFGPEYYVKNNIIYVSFNYRTGPYGFMCLDTPDVPGNQGLKDQLLALRWVKDNIASFGGDVNKITVMGESAGGISIDFHLMSKKEKLFNQAIILSGGAVRPLSIIDSDLTVPIKISEQLGFNTNNITESLSFLANVDRKLVIAAYSERSLILKPCVEKEFVNVDRFIFDYPWNLDVPKVKYMPVLIGFNNFEGLTRYARQPYGYFTKKNYIRDSLKYIFNIDDNSTTLENQVQHFYFEDEELTEKLKEEVLEFESDYFYGFASQWTSEKYISQGAKDVYLYLFSYDGGKNYIKNKLNIKHKGAAHGDQLGYLYDMDDNKIARSDVHDQLVTDRMTKLWSNFVKYGNPTPETSELLPIKWIPITNDTLNYLNIDSDLCMKKQPFRERMAFWEKLFKNNKLTLKGYHQH